MSFNRNFPEHRTGTLFYGAVPSYSGEQNKASNISDLFSF